MLTHEAGLAVSRTAGEDTFWKFSDVLFENQEVRRRRRLEAFKSHEC